MTHEEKALLYFQDKFHCSQSVLAAYAEELGLAEEQALKIAYCLNSGMRKGEVCGACSGALLVLGMKYGQCKQDDLDSRTLANQKTVEFMEHDCFTEVCPKMVASAVKILEDME